MEIDFKAERAARIAQTQAADEARAVDRTQWRPVRASGMRECHICTLTFRADKSGERPCVAHWDETLRRPSMRTGWCPGGIAPTMQQEAARRHGDRRSVRAVSAGLPTLGKRGN